MRFRERLVVISCSTFAVACGWISPVPAEERAAIAAARDNVTAQFANAAGVEFSELKIAGPVFFPNSVVCGIVDSEELTRPSRFIFVLPNPDVDVTTPTGRRWPPRPGLRMHLPPRIDGSDRTEEHYWEAVVSAMPEFETRWAEQCATAH